MVTSTSSPCCERGFECARLRRNCVELANTSCSYDLTFAMSSFTRVLHGCSMMRNAAISAP